MEAWTDGKEEGGQILLNWVIIMQKKSVNSLLKYQYKRWK